jgi:hypothetical protein
MIGDLENDAAQSAAASSSVPDDGPDTSDREGLLKTAKAWFRDDREHTEQWRKDAKEDYDFANLRQWSEEDKRVLRDQMRPEITFDKIGTTVKTVLGIEIGNRREVRYFPRTQGDAKPDEVLTSAAQWARDACDAEDEETDSFRDCIICGMGWIDTRMEYEVEPEGMIRQERLDPLEMFWDGSACKPNLADARRTWRVRTIPIEDARLLAPDAEDADLDAAWARGKDDKEEPHNADPRLAYQQDIDEEEGGHEPGETVTLVHLQYWERENYYRVAWQAPDQADPSVSGGQRVETINEADWRKFKRYTDALTAQYGMPPIKYVKQVRKVYKQALIGAKVLSMGPAACEGHFSWECVTGERDQNEGTWYGVVRGMKDPQRWANKWLSQSLHILNTNAKGGLFAERGAFDNDMQAEESYARSDRITWLKQGAIAGNRIQPKVAPPLPQDLAGLMQYALSSIRDASGVNLELAGLQENTDQSGILAEHRKQSGMTILASLFDSLRRYRKRQGRIMLYFIQTYISDGRLIRIVGEEGAQYVPLIHQPGLVEYDVVVDDDPTSTNQKEKVWATLMQMMPFLGDKLDAQDLAILFEYSPLPQSVVETWQKKIETDQQQQAPIQQQMMQLQMQLLETKSLLQSAQAQKAQADAAKAAAEASTAGAGDPAAGAQAQLEYEKMLQDGQIRGQQVQSDAQIKAGKAQSDAEIAAAKATSAHVLAQQKLDNEHALATAKLAADMGNKDEQRKADLVTEAGWMATDRATKAHAAVISAAGKIQAARITAAHRPKTSPGR